jgi:hypothetical protein
MTIACVRQFASALVPACIFKLTAPPVLAQFVVLPFLHRPRRKFFSSTFNCLPRDTKKVVDSRTKNYTPARQSKQTINEREVFCQVLAVAFLRLSFPAGINCPGSRADFLF